jgi:tetratricopeptide (TPR) repeat protein
MGGQVNRTRNVLGGFLGLFLLISGGPALRALSSFSEGEELFMRNKPQEALKYLEAAVAEDPAHVQAFLYLGIAYLQVNRVDDAIATYRKILPRGGTESARIAYNLGNAYFVKGDSGLARQYYTQAIEINPSYSSAYLNRANTLVKSGELSHALTDYEAYLSVEPGSPKREQVLRLMTFIREEFAATERRRIMAEEAARAETERRRRLLEEVSESLQAAAEGSRGLSAGSEDVQDYDGEFELE